MPATNRFTKSPEATLDYKFDWSRWLPTGDTIATSSMTADTGLTVASDTHDTSTATVWLSGGTDGQNYDVVNEITTAGGRTDERTMVIQVRTL